MTRAELVTVEDLSNFKAELLAGLGRILKETKGVEKKWLKTCEVKSC